MEFIYTPNVLYIHSFGLHMCKPLHPTAFFGLKLLQNSSQFGLAIPEVSRLTLAMGSDIFFTCKLVYNRVVNTEGTKLRNNNNSEELLCRCAQLERKNEQEEHYQETFVLLGSSKLYILKAGLLPV